MKKKLFAALMAGLMTLSLAACGSSTSKAPAAEAPAESASQEAPAEAPAEETAESQVYKVGIVVSVQKDELRKALEAAGVIKSLNYGF